MENQNSSNSTSVLLKIMLILAVIGLGFLLFKSGKNPESQYTELNVTNNTERTEIRSTETPNNIPQDLPFITQGTVLQNFTNESQTNIQAVRRWVVEGTPEAITQSFMQYFSANNWKEISRLQSGELTIIGFNKNNLALSFSASKQPETSQTVIEVTVIATKK